jgi:hypothetical protein
MEKVMKIPFEKCCDHSKLPLFALGTRILGAVYAGRMASASLSVHNSL